MFVVADYFFTVFHTLLTLFNLFGWIHPKTRKVHLITVGLTLLSWIGLGFFYGWGYCFLTDWHYQVLEKMGHEDLPYSYITFLIERLSGQRLDDGMVVTSTLWTFAVVVVITIAIQVRTRMTGGNNS